MNGRQKETRRKSIFLRETVGMWFSPGSGIRSLKRLKDLILPFLELTLRRCMEMLGSFLIPYLSDVTVIIPVKLLASSLTYHHFSNTIKRFCFLFVAVLNKIRKCTQPQEVIYQKAHLEEKHTFSKQGAGFGFARAAPGSPRNLFSLSSHFLPLFLPVFIPPSLPPSLFPPPSLPPHFSPFLPLILPSSLHPFFPPPSL